MSYMFGYLKKKYSSVYLIRNHQVIGVWNSEITVEESPEWPSEETPNKMDRKLFHVHVTKIIWHFKVIWDHIE